jgi:hypothetical protein
MTKGNSELTNSKSHEPTNETQTAKEKKRRITILKSRRGEEH